jgi:hypothetical protein
MGALATPWPVAHLALRYTLLRIRQVFRCNSSELLHADRFRIPALLPPYHSRCSLAAWLLGEWGLEALLRSKRDFS